MFRIADGREHFYQWDLDRQVIVEDSSIVEVHFCNRTDDCSLVVEVKDGLANVPNVLLQSSYDIRVFGYDGKATYYEKKFKVYARTRPADYVYDETELVTVQTMIDRANQTLEVTNEALANTEKALRNTEEAINNSAEALERANTANDRAETAVSDVERFANDAKESADKAQAAVVNYYTKEETLQAIDDAHEAFYFDFAPYNSGNYFPAPADLAAVLDRVIIGEPLVLFIKDGGNTYAIADIKLYTERLLELRTHYSGVDTETHISSWDCLYTTDDGIWQIKKTRNLNFNYATQTYVDEAIAAIEIPDGPGGDVDLSDYYTKDETVLLIADAIEDIEIPDVSGKMDKITGGTASNFIMLDTNGNAKDSSFNSTSFVPMAAFSGAIVPHMNDTNIHWTKDAINALIDTKITAIPSAEGGAY